VTDLTYPAPLPAAALARYRSGPRLRGSDQYQAFLAGAHKDPGTCCMMALVRALILRVFDVAITPADHQLVIDRDNECSSFARELS
jgi:hypothetical protein